MRDFTRTQTVTTDWNDTAVTAVDSSVFLKDFGQPLRAGSEADLTDKTELDE